ncbi:MAG: VTT domain-containing protein [Rickettsiales bacterium]|jgi:membrane protein YqaA with SNARE-associated domain|nr:VTT domain-containing protein [Rickettsiales bacterium]
MATKNLKFAEFILRRSGHPAFSWIVFFLTVCESVFLFIPPEVFMTPPIIANRRRAIPVTIAAAMGSLIGGIIAYTIGLWLFESVGVWLIETFSSMDRFAVAQAMFAKHGLFIIFLAAFTPVPYKLLAICAGFLQFNPLLFIGISAIFRTLRFAIVGFLLWRFQEQANMIVKKYFWPLTLGAIVAAGLGIGLMCLL